MSDDDDTALPIRPVEAWADSKGHLYPTKTAALLVEIERVLGHFGTGESMAPGIARLLVSKRHELIPLLDAVDPETPDLLEPISLEAEREKRKDA